MFSFFNVGYFNILLHILIYFQKEPGNEVDRIIGVRANGYEAAISSKKLFYIVDGGIGEGV
jgi:hypothetical protein